MIPSPLTKLVCPVFLALHAGEPLLLPQAVHLGLTVPGADSAGSDSSGSARLVLSIRFCPFLAGFISKGLLVVSSAGGITAVRRLSPRQLGTSVGLGDQKQSDQHSCRWLGLQLAA